LTGTIEKTCPCNQQQHAYKEGGSSSTG